MVREVSMSVRGHKTAEEGWQMVPKYIIYRGLCIRRYLYLILYIHAIMRQKMYKLS